MNENIWSNFTNQYSLSKTLRFELRPIGETQKMLEENEVFEKGKVRRDKYEKLKLYFDRLHREFVKESLENASFSNLVDYEKSLRIFEKETDKKKKKTLEKTFQENEKNLRKEIVVFFNSKAEEWSKNYPGLKNSDLKILDEEAVFSALLKKRYGDKEDSFLREKEKGEFLLDEEDNRISIFDDWKGFTGYFKKFFETRKNFYKDDGKEGRIATRIVNQNLRRFCDNLENFRKIRNKINFLEVEKHFGKSLTEVFSLDFYNKCLLQEGINFYNKVLGGEILLNGEKRKGINELINEYRQIHKREKIPFLKLLDKQILSETDKGSFIDEIKNDKELLDILRDFQKTAKNKVKVLQMLFSDFIKNNESYDLSKIYIEEKVFNPNSSKYIDYNNVTSFYEILKDYKLTGIPIKKKKGKALDFIDLSYIKSSLEKSTQEKFWKEKYYKSDNNANGFLSLTNKNNIWNQFLMIFDFEFQSLLEKEIVDNKSGKFLKIGYNIYDQKIDHLLKNFEVTKDSKIIIKDFSDSVLRIYQMAKYFAIEKKREWLGDFLETGEFYNNPEIGYKNYFYDGAYEDIIKVYNKIRNYLTKKPWEDVQKWKLNFENPTLADGWDKNKEPDNFAIILRKDEKYYLGLMKKGSNHIFADNCKDKFTDKSGEGRYEKMVYKQISDASKDIQNLIVINGKTVRKTGGKGKLKWERFCEKSNIATNSLNYFDGENKILEYFKNEYLPSDINKIRIQRSYSKSSNNFNTTDLYKFIDFYKERLDYFDFDFKLKNTNQYEDFSQFTDDLSNQGYKISFQDVSESYINEKNQSGELYLFEIHNKDWNKGAKGKKNLHTMYFESLFSNQNEIQNFLFKLNGQAEIFYRPKTATEKLGIKKDRQGKDVINHKRYNENKIFFHVPITINRTKGKLFKFNNKINNYIANNSDVNIIGVDRGEKHIAYYSVINQSGEILQDENGNPISGTLNLVGQGKDGKPIDYHKKLGEKAKNRERERKDWQTIEGIKDLKKGYISQVVYKLANLAIKYNAIIVFEDLNMRFKQIRGGIEKSAYQQLEKALIDKLSFLVNKEKSDPDESGHLMNAYQLVAPFESFQKMGKQTGIIFYTEASYTSKIDPITGWRQNLYLKYSKAKNTKEDILKFEKIEFRNNRFEFTYDITKFRKLKNIPKKTKWTVCSCVERYRWNRKLNQNKGGYEHYENLTEEFIKLFKDYDIDIKENILEQIRGIEPKGNEKFFSRFVFLFKLVCQIRNTDEKVDDINKQDFILSPVEPFFDSRLDNGNNLPKNGDDNGAYNIARKGIIILKKISEFAKNKGDCEKMKWGDLYVSQKDWDNFAQMKK